MWVWSVVAEANRSGNNVGGSPENLTSGLTLIKKAGAFYPGYPQPYVVADRASD